MDLKRVKSPRNRRSTLVLTRGSPSCWSQEQAWHLCCLRNPQAESHPPHPRASLPLCTMSKRTARNENYLSLWENAAKAIINPTCFSHLDVARKILVSFSLLARMNRTLRVCIPLVLFQPEPEGCFRKSLSFMTWKEENSCQDHSFCQWELNGCPHVHHEHDWGCNGTSHYGRQVNLHVQLLPVLWRAQDHHPGSQVRPLHRTSESWEAQVLKVLLLDVRLFQGSLAILPHQVPQDYGGHLGGPAGTHASHQGCMDANQCPWRTRLDHAWFCNVVLKTLDFICFWKWRGQSVHYEMNGLNGYQQDTRSLTWTVPDTAGFVFEYRIKALPCFKILPRSCLITILNGYYISMFIVIWSHWPPVIDILVIMIAKCKPYWQ